MTFMDQKATKKHKFLEFTAKELPWAVNPFSRAISALNSPKCLRTLILNCLCLFRTSKTLQNHKLVAVYGQELLLGRKPLFVGQKSLQAHLRP